MLVRISLNIALYVAIIGTFTLWQWADQATQGVRGVRTYIPGAFLVFMCLIVLSIASKGSLRVKAINVGSNATISFKWLLFSSASLVLWGFKHFSTSVTEMWPAFVFALFCVTLSTCLIYFRHRQVG
ncbi:MAG: hypothetical protein ACRDAM_04385 [Casimicrobium sp.]